MSAAAARPGLMTPGVGATVGISNLVSEPGSSLSLHQVGSVIRGRIFKDSFIHISVRKTEVLLSGRYKKRVQRLKIQTGHVHGKVSEKTQ